MKIAVLATFTLFLSNFSWAQNSNEDLDFLKQLVSISSGTADHQGVAKVQDAVAEKLKALGMTVQLIDNPAGKDTSAPMLVAELKGTEPKFITLVTHADTVFEKLNPFTLSSDGLTAHGSGVIDNKGGLVLGIAALRDLLKEKDRRYSLRIIVSPCEEIGSPGWAPLFKKFSEDSIFLIGLEPSLDNGNYVSGRKGVRWYDIHIVGKEAHAGAHHDEGINACQDLAIKIAAMQALTDYKKGNTVSIGRIDGGKDKFNIICGEAEAKIDTRFSTPENAKKLFAQIEKILNHSNVESAKSHEKTTTRFDNPVDTAPLPESMKTKKLMKEFAKLVKGLEGKEINGEFSGGVADLNQMVSKDSLIADGMGPTGGGVHTNEEFLTVSSLKTRTQALTQFLKYLDQNITP